MKVKTPQPNLPTGSGNIQSLQRGTQTGSLSTNSYQYLGGGNRLGSINSGGLFTYDLNGNMTKHGHKGFVVEYNHLNLPRKVSLGTGNISYIYSASGQKLAKRQPTGTMRYYAGNTEYQGTTPDIIHTPEGYVEVAGGSYNYHYTLKDHLGNTRVVYNAASHSVAQVADYYPFGMSHTLTYPNPSVSHKYLYNGKEQQDDLGLGWYDYGARFYDAEIGRWHSVDPLAEDYISWSIYNYTMNNPVRYIDPDGMRVNSPLHGGVPAQMTSTGYTSAQSSTYIPPQDQAVLEFNQNNKPKPPTLDDTSTTRINASISILKVGIDSDGDMSVSNINTSGFDTPILCVSNKSETQTVSEYTPTDLDGGGFTRDVIYKKNTLTMKTGLFLMGSASEQTIEKNGAVIERGTARGISLSIPLSYKGIGFQVGIHYTGPYKRK